MGLASGVILDSQIDASDHVGELILEKVQVCSWISPAIPHSFGISWYILQDHFSSESAVRLKSSPMLQEETVSCIRWLAPLRFDSVTSLLSVSQARESGSSLSVACWMTWNISNFTFFSFGFPAWKWKPKYSKTFWDLNVIWGVKGRSISVMKDLGTWHPEQWQSP